MQKYKKQTTYIHTYTVMCNKYIILITRVNVRYGDIFHEPKANETSRNISRETSMISDLTGNTHVQ